MSSPSNHFKLGLFVLLAVAAMLGSAIALGAASSQKKTVTYHTFFNESVQGLDIGSPVRYRGVIIGTVAVIQIAPDHRHVDVLAELDVSEIRRMGLTEGGSEGKGEGRFIIPSDLRAQLGSQGITGVKYVSIDFFDEKANPPPELPFPTPRNYIPAAASLMKNLEDSIVKAVDKMPAVADSLMSILTRIDSIMEEIQSKKVPDKAIETLDEVDGALKDLRKVLAHIDRANLPDKAAVTIDHLNVAVGKLNQIFDRVDGDQGLVASAHKATDAIGAFGKTADGRAKELADTLRDVGEAAQSIRDLADTLERDPDMLLKGRAKEKQP
jgi:phospholipid/cholesterol/gamma-HCH transport system substrate-binding protein